LVDQMTETIDDLVGEDNGPSKGVTKLAAHIEKRLIRTLRARLIKNITKPIGEKVRSKRLE